MSMPAAPGSRWPAVCITVTFLGLAACSPEPAPDAPAGAGDQSVVVHSKIAPELLRPLFEAYTADTGVGIQLVSAELAALPDGFHRSEPIPEADLFIAGDIAALWLASEENVLRPTRSEPIERRIPARLRDPERLWVSLSTRARTVVRNPDLTDDAELATVTGYVSLADQTWRRRLCLSSFGVAGNDTLVAMLILDLGQQEAVRVVRGWAANLAAGLFADDAGLLRGLADGDCAIGVADSSEIARFLESESDANLVPHWFAAGGVVHVNVSGGGVTRHARNAEGAVSLLEWMTSDKANAMFAAAILEFPANPNAATDEAIAPWSGFAPHPANVASLGYRLEDAWQLVGPAREH